MFATLAMVLVAFDVLSRRAAAEGAEEPASGESLGAAETVYGPGTAITPLLDGRIRVQYLPTFQRWDGVWRPTTVMDRSAGEWPYLVEETPIELRVTRLGRTFTQAKVPGAIYEFLPEAIKETIVIPLMLPDGTVSIPFLTAYSVGVQGDGVVLRDANGSVAWTTAPFRAWDSAESPRTWDRPVSILSYGNGELKLGLDPAMLSGATFPLYVDPTWTLSTTAGWGASTFQDAVEDKGDHAIKSGWLADNFDDNTNEIWTITAGSSFVLTGGRAEIAVTEVHAGGSWSDQKFESTVNFASCGVLNMFFRYQNGGNNYRLRIQFGSQNIQLLKSVGSTTSLIGPSLPVTINAGTDYVAKVVALGNTFEVWWNGAKLWSGSDASPPATPLSGNVGFAAAGACVMYLDNVRVWNTPTGSMTTSVRDAGSSRPIDTKVVGAVDPYSQLHTRIRSSADNILWGPWTNLKADMVAGVFHKVPDQDRQRYYQLRVILSTGTDGTPALSELTTNEGSPATSPSATTGREGWYPYVGGLVNAVNGNLWYSAQDISVQGRGFPLPIVRSYNSLRASESGPFGNGWAHALGQKLVINPDRTVTWNDGDGSQHAFQPKELQRSPAAHSGSWANGQNAFSSNNVYATTSTSGALHTYSAYGLAGPADMAFAKIEVCVEGRTASNGDDDVGVRISTDGGATWSLEQILNLPTSDAGTLTCLDYTSYRASWRWSDVSDAKLRVQVRYVKVGNKASTNSLDWIPVRVTTSGYGPPAGVPSRLIKNTDGSYSLWQADGSRLAFTSAGRLTSVTDKNGNRLTLNYDANGRLTSVADDSGKSAALAYDGSGRVIRATDPLNRQINYTYDASGRLTSAADALNQIESYSYDASGRLSTIVDPVGRWANFVYDASARVTEIWAGFYEAGGVVWKFKEWSIAYSTTTTRTITNARSHQTTLILNSFGNPPEVNGPPIGDGSCAGGGNVTRCVWDGERNRIRTEDGRGNAWSMDYGLRGNVLSRTDPGGNASASTWREINSASQYIVLLTNQTNFRGLSTTVEYDANGNLVLTKNGDGVIAETVYDAFGFVNKTKDGRGDWTYFEYNANGYPTKIMNNMSEAITYGYDAVGRRTTATSAFGHTTITAYDADDRVVKITDPLGNFTRHGYNARGDRTSVTDPNGNTTTYGINVTNRQVQLVTDASGNNTQYSYDLAGNLASVTDARQKITTYEYDSIHRLTKTTSPLGFNTTNVYDAAGNGISRKDANGAVTTYEFDKLNRLAKIRYQDGNVTSFVYDKNGNPTSESGFGYTKTTSYDNLDRPGAVTLNYGSFSKTTSYTYDANGNRLGMKPPDDAYRSIVLRPVANGQVVQWYPLGCTLNYDCVDETSSDGDTTYVVESVPGEVDMYTFQDLPTGTSLIRSVRVSAMARVPTPCEAPTCWGRIQFRVNGYESPDIGVGVGTTYSEKGFTWTLNPATEKAWTEAEVSALEAGIKLHSTNWFVQVTQVYVTVEVEPFLYAYDKATRLTRLADPEGRIATYVYDKDGRQTSIASANGVATTNRYDDAGRLFNVTTTKSDGTGLEFFNYTYDKAGNRLTMKTNEGTWRYEYDKLYRLVKEVQPSGTTITYKYDAVGNRIEKAEGTAKTTYAYDADNRLTLSQLYLGTILWIKTRYEYDNNGNVLRKLEDFVTEGTLYQTDYAYDHEKRVTKITYHDGVVCSFSYLPTGERIGQSCSPSTYFGYDFYAGGGFGDVAAEYDSTGARDARYTHGPGADEPLGVLRGGAYYAYHADALGSVTKITDSGQGVVRSYRYGAFGEIVSESGTLQNSYGYTARERRDGFRSYLLDYRARMYDPSVGRFLQKDPAGMADGPNLYAYVGNNPVNRADPSGRHFEGCYGWECRYGHDHSEAGGATAGGGGGGLASATTPQGPVWTDTCTFMTVMTLVAIAFAWMGFGLVDAGLARAVWNAHTSWAIGAGMGTTVSKNPAALVPTILSIITFIIMSLPWWQAIGAGATFAGKMNPFGLSVMIVLTLVQIGFLVWSLISQRCI